LCLNHGTANWLEAYGSYLRWPGRAELAVAVFWSNELQINNTGTSAESLTIYAARIVHYKVTLNFTLP